MLRTIFDIVPAVRFLDIRNCHNARLIECMFLKVGAHIHMETCGTSATVGMMFSMEQDMVAATAGDRMAL